MACQCVQSLLRKKQTTRGEKDRLSHVVALRQAHERERSRYSLSRHQKVHHYTAALLALYDKHAPLRTFVVKKKPTPWMTVDLKSIIKTRNRAHRNFTRNRSAANRDLYKHLRNRVKLEIRNAKHRYYHAKLSDCRNTREMWKIVDEMGLKPSSRAKGDLVASPDDYNRHFVGSDMAAALHDIRPTARIAPDDQFYFGHVQVEEVLEAFGAARSNALGPDSLPLRFLKDCLSQILPVLMHIFDVSFQSCNFPALWKRALVLPLPKISHPLRLEDYRPISLLCATSKIFESIACKKINSYISAGNMLNPFQSGFRKGHSTHTALIAVADDIRQGIDEGEVTLLVSVDQSRAFDLVNIELLVDKLRAFGFSDSACNWVRSFLSDRSQVVLGSNEDRSAPLPRLCGVPQGSLPGPLFFMLYADDLPDVCGGSNYHMYADDFCFYIRGKARDADSLVRRANQILANISEWAAVNGLRINSSKTKAIWFGSRAFCKQISSQNVSDIVIDGQVISPCESLKLLGITLDNSLAWRQQCTITCNKSFSSLGRLRRCGYFLPRSTKLSLVKSLVFPYFTYCAALFLGISKELATKLERCVNAALRFVEGIKKHEHITPVYGKHKILSYSGRRNYVALTLIATVLRTSTPSYLRRKLELRPKDKMGSKRASELDLVLPTWNTDCYEHSFRIGAAKLWNELPHELRMMHNQPGFKKSLQEHCSSIDPRLQQPAAI